ncbi:hypothetical protein MTR67_022491 [Solanum verrucosum]|uniref:DUF4218 domain-containing protein n=1 Tax=Solanum verrucosum TaxID=315347 RepID=A0AAF0TQT7_SOLVR|nr:hypothetical protein MTR67_022491 [Solanum verrucosum]
MPKVKHFKNPLKVANGRASSSTTPAAQALPDASTIPSQAHEEQALILLQEEQASIPPQQEQAPILPQQEQVHVLPSNSSVPLMNQRIYSKYWNVDARDSENAIKQIHVKANEVNNLTVGERIIVVFYGSSMFSEKKSQVDTKKLFLTTLKNIKVPDGYSSNISRCVDLAQKKISGLKSHDSHVLLEQLLPLAIRNVLPDHVVTVLVEFFSFFRALSSKTLNPSELDILQERFIITLCHLDMLFPPSFFTVMVHLSVHLVDEAKLGGPVHYRNMYPMERELGYCKPYIRNKSQPEGCIAEGHIAEKTLTFCSWYIEDIETRFNRPRRVHDEPTDMPARMSSLFPQLGKPTSASENFPLNPMQKLQAHRYVLLNCAIVMPFVDEFREYIKRSSRGRRPSPTEIERRVNKQFVDWFQKRVRWSVAMHLKPRDLYDMGEVMEEQVYENEPYQEQELDQFFGDGDDTISLSKCLALEKLKLVDESVNVLDLLLQLPGRLAAVCAILITQGTPISVKLKGVRWRSFPVNFPDPQLMSASFYKLEQINPRTRPADVPANKERKGVCYEFLYFILAFNIPPGQQKSRPLFPWRHYFQNTHRLIFVVDRNDNDHVVEARDKLHRVLNEAQNGRHHTDYFLTYSINYAGPMHKKDVMKASVMLERKKELYATILAFDVKVTQEAREL